MLKIDYETIYKNTGIDFRNIKDQEQTLFDYLKTIAEYLQTHNKNYTKSQYQKIDDITEILKAISTD